jgi:hypothetical protein
MGSLVWTSPSALKFQINRADVFAEDSSTRSFNARHTDYASGCGYVDIDFVDYGDDVFAAPAFQQDLSVYDALMTARGKGVSARVLAWNERDVFAVEVDDEREQPSPINIDLRMLRYMVQYQAGKNYALSSRHIVQVVTRNHTAASQLDIRNGKIVLTQEFKEGDYYDSSAIVIGVVGRDSKARYANDSTVRLSAAPGKGRFLVLIASAAGFDRNQDVASRAITQLNEAAGAAKVSLSPRSCGSTVWRSCPTTSPPRCATSTWDASPGASARRALKNMPAPSSRTPHAGTGSTRANGLTAGGSMKIKAPVPMAR